MSRYTGPKCRLCRREGVKLFLKGEKCESPKCPLVVRQSTPGKKQSTKRRSKPSDFGLQLREKQKAKRIYGLSEQQFRKYFQSALGGRGKTGEALLVKLETRLDNVIYRLGWGASRSQARQRISHGLFRVNNQIVNYPSFEVKSQNAITSRGVKVLEKPLPAWLSWVVAGNEARVLRLPDRKDVAEDITESLIVEHYSK